MIINALNVCYNAVNTGNGGFTMTQYTVTQRANQYKQPRGGFIPVASLNTKQFKDDEFLPIASENITPSFMGLVVDYLTRFEVTGDVVGSFGIPEIGAHNVDLLAAQKTGHPYNGNMKRFKELTSQIKGLDDQSIQCAIQLVNYDIAYRMDPSYYVPRPKYQANQVTLEHVQKMVKRGAQFLHAAAKGGPIMVDFDFPGAYTKTVVNGDGDYLTKSGLWDFKVSKAKPTNKFTLQILMYYIMGMHSENQSYFETVKQLGLFYPRQNLLYLINVSDISKSTMATVTNDVIGY